MITALCGTPGTGKTATAEVLRERGWDVRDMRTLILEIGASEGSGSFAGELEVDIDDLRVSLAGWGRGMGSDIVVEGHMSYLLPASLVLLLRVHPDVLRERLLSRGYPISKVRENAEAEAVSSLLFDCMEAERVGLDGRDWEDLPEGASVTLEMDSTGMAPDEVASWAASMMGAFKGKRFNDMLPFRPPKVDWLEVLGEWSWTG